MCGIVGAVAERDVVPLLEEGLSRLEYRGYDSAGLAALDRDQGLTRRRAVGKVAALSEALASRPVASPIGIAHTRWATHGEPCEANAHPHLSNNSVALVHNGIIENHESLRSGLAQQGYAFESETDTEVIAHRLHARTHSGAPDLLAAVQAETAELTGAYALCALHCAEPERLVVARKGCPVVIGIGIGEHFVASDVTALLPVTRRFIFLHEGDVAEITRHRVRVFDAAGHHVTRDEHESELSLDAVERGPYRHFMAKEIHEQPRAIAETLEARLAEGHVLDAVFGHRTTDLLAHVEAVHLVACGTSYHAAQVARYAIERRARLPVSVDIASEYRYREPVVGSGTLFVAISQSGETADTLAALREARRLGYAATLAICNVPESSLAREADLVALTRAGPEIGVASTKAFTTQLTALAMLALVLARGTQAQGDEATGVERLTGLPAAVERVLALDDTIATLAEELVDKRHALFLGRGSYYPIAMEGALKLKEISYIHAEAYAAGELKHGPLALVDESMPVIAIAPNDALVEKLASNLREVRARGGRLIVFAGESVQITPDAATEVIRLPEVGGDLDGPLLYTLPLQLLAYHVACLKGTDVDKPRNLAKSVTVE